MNFILNKNVNLLKIKFPGLVASSPGMTYQSVPIMAGQGPMQTTAQPGNQYPGINFGSLELKYI